MKMSMPSMPAMNLHGNLAPATMKPAVNPTFPVGSKVILNTNHMPGMMGAKAEVVGVYTTTLYEVDFKPTNGGPEVFNHKWVVQEELQNPTEKPAIGAVVTLEANHMEFMKGAQAKIVAAVQGDAYMVNYLPNDGSAEVTNHKWLTASELKLRP